MTALLEFKENLKSFYAKYEIYITPVLKFLTAFISLFYINKNLGFMSKIDNIGVVLLLSIACAILPTNTMVLLSAIFVLAHLYQLSLTVALVALVLMVIMFLLYFAFSSKESYVVVLTPIAFFLHIPYAIPLTMGLIGTSASAIPVSFGIILYYLIQYAKQSSSIITNSEAQNMLQTYTYIIDNVIMNKEMLLTIVAFSVTVLCVRAVRRMSIDYSWMVAISTGAVINLLVMLVGDYMLNITNNIVLLLLGMLVSVILVSILKFFLFGVDYTRTEYVQFEDDEYYYYVKAVPKMTITTPEKKVKRIYIPRKGTKKQNNKTDKS